MEQVRTMMHQLLSLMVSQNASDLHISTNSPPKLRIDGILLPIKSDVLTPAQTRALCLSLLDDEQRQRFDAENELDFSFGIDNVGRFRGNIFVQRGSVAGAFRYIPNRIRSFEELSLPPILREFSELPRGLVLVTGPTGSGKSTTLAAMIDHINRNYKKHIITIEDPIEYIHQNRQCLVNQREVGTDTASFHRAIHYILRQDPDVVLMGELRDRESIETALVIAETGHLVLSTLHTNSCAQTVNRIVDVFPATQHDQIRTQLSFVLEGVVCQQLLLNASGKGRSIALEILVATPGIRNLIRDDKTHMIYSTIQLNRAKTSMQTMNQALGDLVLNNKITPEEAFAHSSDPAELKQIIGVDFIP